MKPAGKATFWFIGVTTGQSSIMRVFPEWARHLGLGDVDIRGIDLVPHDRPERYREVVSFLKSDPLSRGALVTTHKLDLFAAARDMFDEIDPHAALMEETSCLSKRDGRFLCHAKDPISSGLAIDGFVPKGHFARTKAEVFSMGAGGSTIALTWHLSQSA
ncbi:MAG: shikimate dehydrogenase, partial [Rhodobacterales bacterium]